MHTKTVINKQCEAVLRAQDVYSQARSFHLPHERILVLLSEKVYSVKMPRYAMAYVRGYVDCLANKFYQTDLEWRVFYNGSLVKPSDVPKGEWSNVIGDKGRHVYKNAPDIAVF